MKQKNRIILLLIYDLIIALSAIRKGIRMIRAEGIFMEYPKEWLTKVPFQSWFVPGVIGILIFGVGNIIAAAFCLRKEGKQSWIISGLMGGIFFISLVAQIIILDEVYLATAQFFIISIIQLCLSGYVFLGDRKRKSIKLDK
ncbi:hypothetical protein [Oceanirhabdus sp. W0125-5]|uniref:hypothetical protein n=1 Tax=Oceanirhabdus sp. W0125-5 TaxID=2999116 RepID=UPI0022F310DB|nr:hypothetical protein [Oceanirhabdus sp. W0125-5]WBW94721.1 hypothetical protein OW730_13550 [Oceanirhabdus sp. W0125-5]